MTDLEKAILFRFDTDETRGVIKYYRENQNALELRNKSICDNLAQHLENATRSRLESCPDNLLTDIVLHSLLDVDWQVIAENLEN